MLDHLLQVPKSRSQSSYSLPINHKYLKKTSTQNQQLNSISQEKELKGSYSILKMQMEDNGKVSIQTNRRTIRTFSASKLNDSLKQEFINTGQFFYYTPTKIPSPLHQITLTKQKKNVTIRLTDQRKLLRPSATSDLIKNKIKSAQKKSKLTIQTSNKLQLEPQISYSKLFQQISENPLKYYGKPNQYSILFNDQLVKKINSIRGTQIIK